MSALSPLVPVEDLEAWIGSTFGTSDLARAVAVLDAVSGLVRSEAGQDWSTTPVPAQVAGVVKEVTSRILANPGAVKQQTTGPFTVQYEVVAGLFLTAEQRLIVARTRASQRGLWTQPTTRIDPADTGIVYALVAGTTEPVPLLDDSEGWW